MKNASIIVLLAITVCFLFFDQSPAFYQWEDENGVVHFGDAPPGDVDNAIEKSENGSAPDSVQSEKPLPPPMPDKPDNLPGGKHPAPQSPEDIKEIIDTFTLSPHTKKEISFAAFAPAKIGFKTDITPETAVRCKNSGAGIKDRYSGEEVISPYGGSCEFIPKNGYIKFYVGNLEDFSIKITVFKQ